MRTPTAVGTSLCVAVALLTGGCTAGGDPAAAPSGAARTAAPPSAPATATAPPPESGAAGDAAEPTASAEPAEDGSQAAALARVPGDDSGACVTVDGHRDVRSGNVMGGPFDTAGEAWGTERPGRDPKVLDLYWVPLHAGTTAGVTVEAKRSGSEDRVTTSSDSPEQAELWTYYATGLELPEAGTWRVEVTSGVDKGCFELTLED